MVPYINPLQNALVPTVVEQTNKGERAYDIYSRLLNDRIVFLSDEVNDVTASLIASSGSNNDSSSGTDEPAEPTPGAHTFDANHVCTACGLDARFKPTNARASDYTNYTYHLKLGEYSWCALWERFWTAYQNGELNSESLIKSNDTGFEFYAIKDTSQNAGYLVFRVDIAGGVHLDLHPKTPGIYGYYNLVEFYADINNVDNSYFERYPDVTSYTFETADNVAIYNREIWGDIFTENYNADGYADLLASTCPNAE